MKKEKIGLAQKIWICNAIIYLAILAVQVRENGKSRQVDEVYNDVLRVYTEACFKDFLKFPK